MSFTFTGTITQNLWNNETITPNCLSLCPPDPNTGYSYTPSKTRTFNPFNQPIKWNSAVPSVIQNLSINEIAQLDIDYNFNLNYLFTVKEAQQFYQCGAKTYLNMNIYRPAPTDFILTYNFEALNSPGSQGDLQYCTSTTCPTFNTGEQITPGNFPTSEAYDIQLIPWNSTCDFFSIENLTFEIVTNISLIVSCSTPEELNSDFCFNFCTFNEDNLKNCYPAYRNYCLINTRDPSNINIFTNQNCLEFFEDYFAQVGPNATTDNDLENACSLKFPFPSIDAYDNADRNVQNICACHLPQEIYDNLRNSLINQFPGFQAFPIDERCLFPNCASSNFSTIKIGKACSLPACINLASVTNDGNLKGGVNINQNDQCLDLKNGTFNNGGGGGTVEEIKTWIDKYWVWLVIGIAILVVLIIIILVVLAGEGNKKKKVVKEEKI